jgi:hypothetical protein
LSELTLQRPRVFGDCWLACRLWDELHLEEFWRPRLPDGRAEVPWVKVLELLTVRQLVKPGSKWHLHRRWFLSSAMDQLLDEDFAVAAKNRLYACLDRIEPDRRERAWKPDTLLLKLGAARKEAGRAWHFVKVSVPRPRQPVNRDTFRFQLRKDKLQAAQLRDGHYLLRSFRAGDQAGTLWECYMQLTKIEAAFKSLKSDLQIRPFRHHLEARIEAHILVCFLAYCLSVTLPKRLAAHAPGLTARAVLERLSTILMLDVHLPLADGRELVLPRYTQPEQEQRLVLEKLGWELPPQPPPRIRSAQAKAVTVNGRDRKSKM